VPGTTGARHGQSLHERTVPEDGGMTDDPTVSGAHPDQISARIHAVGPGGSYWSICMNDIPPTALTPRPEAGDDAAEGEAKESLKPLPPMLSAHTRR
jgi:hypothetical protein